MNDSERRAFQEELRHRRDARAVLEACGVDLTWITRTEQARVEASIEKVVAVVKRIERAGFARGWSEAVAELFEFLPEQHDPKVVEEGLGRRG